eukprot:256212-Amphidinium_carterae.1
MSGLGSPSSARSECGGVQSWLLRTMCVRGPMRVEKDCWQSRVVQRLTSEYVIVHLTNACKSLAARGIEQKLGSSEDQAYVDRDDLERAAGDGVKARDEMCILLNGRKQERLRFIAVSQKLS